MRASLLRLGLLGLTLGASACSWSRFDDLTENSPVLLLEKPDSMNNGFGVSLATATNDGHTQVLVGGTVTTAGAALYEIGQDDAANTRAIDANFCSGNGKPCFLSSLTAGFANAQGPDQLRPLCYAAGTGELVKQGLVVRCRDGNQYTLDMPPLAQELLALSIAQNQSPHDYPMATDRTDNPALLASLPERRIAWFYPEKSTAFSELPIPGGLDIDDPSFGRALAVLAVNGGRVLALGVPGKTEVLLWKTEPGDKVSYIGCLRGGSGMGRALAAGRIKANGSDDLVISDDANVQVVDGVTLFGLPAATSNECVLPGTIPGALKTGFDCKSTPDVADCQQSEFGAALAVGDLDGNGDGEVIVGAPKMTARGQKNAGSLLVYDIPSTGAATLVDTKSMSSAESGDELGRSIVTPHAGKRDIIAAGAPGHGKAALFYCSSLLPNGTAGVHCP
ncbi:MAG TPA: FG-GAP repeat protein [Polyangiaceae bacterium]|nr:FG-GAP repeat protein [Polyangiaceae bacterium]